MNQQKEFVLAGRPNSGKSSLFNRIAGARQRVGNYAGCTVEKKSSVISLKNSDVLLTDLPGLYSLKPNSIDEKVALQHLESVRDTARVVAVVDGNDLQSELSLPILLKKHGYNVVVAVNMLDEVAANRRILNLKGMTDVAGIPFFGVSAKTGEGVSALLNYFDHVDGKIDSSENESDSPISHLTNASVVKAVLQAGSEAKKVDAVNEYPEHVSRLNQRNQKIDVWLVHPVIGPAVLLATMFLLFQAIFTWAAPVADLIDGSVAELAGWVGGQISNDYLSSFLADGLISGLGAVLVFLPQVVILFSLLAVLEHSGYLPRMAYMIDRLFRPFGLDGKVFIPMLSSVACAVPGIMATRTIENPRTRTITMLIAPLMTCSARLPVYTLLIATFVPVTTVWGLLSLQGLVMFSMYFLGIIFALLVALALRFIRVLDASSTVDFLFLPNYRLPQAKDVWLYVWQRTYMFLKKAGTIIAVLTMVVWAMFTFPKDYAAIEGYEAQIAQVAATDPAAAAALENELAAFKMEYSAGGRLGKMLEPLFRPLGYDWRLTVAVVASLAAREVFVATMGTIFALGETDEESGSLIERLRTATNADGTAAYTLATCISLLVFFGISLQCVSTIGILKRESNGWKIPLIAFSYMFGLGYVLAMFAYQATNWFL